MVELALNKYITSEIFEISKKPRLYSYFYIILYSIVMGKEINLSVGGKATSP